MRSPVRCVPAERPLGHGAVAADPVAVVAVVDVGNAVEPRLDPLPDLLPAHQPPTSRSGPAWHVHDAILGEEGHDRVDVVGVERVEEGLKHRGVGLRAGHGCISLVGVSSLAHGPIYRKSSFSYITQPSAGAIPARS